MQRNPWTKRILGSNLSAFLRSSFVFAPSYQPSVFLIYQTQAWQSPDAPLTLARRMASTAHPWTLVDTSRRRLGCWHFSCCWRAFLSQRSDGLAGGFWNRSMRSMRSGFVNGSRMPQH